MDRRNVIRYNHHGKYMAVYAGQIGRHKEHCLCYDCSKFNPSGDNCPIAQALFEFDIKHNITTPVWECAEFVMEG
jgi:hypothetical protein